MKHSISFPALGWEFDISPVLVQFELFGHKVVIAWYGVIIAVGLLLALIYGLKRAKNFDIDPDRMIDVTLVSALFAILGARIYYALFSGDLSAYIEDPLKIFRIWEGGLAIYGGIIAAFLTCFWMCKVRKVHFLSMCDLAALGFLIGQGVGRWGNFFNQEAFGGNTTLPWGMTGSIIGNASLSGGSGYDYTMPVHPTFLYESLWCLLGLVLLHIVSKKAYKFKGQLFAMYIMWYGAGRFMIEGLRTDSLMLGTMRVSQLVAVLSVLGGLALFFVFKNHAARSPANLFDEIAESETEEITEEITEEAAEPVTEEIVKSEADDGETT